MKPIDKFSMPLLGYNYLQWTGGVYHPGLDLGTPGMSDMGMVVRSIKRGTVHYIFEDKISKSHGFGRFVIIKHDDETYSRYSHLMDYKKSDGLRLQMGDKVKAGTGIGHLGGSGLTEDTYSPHLHIEVFGQEMADIQRLHEDPWMFYPNGKPRSYVSRFYMDPWEHFDAQPVSEWAEDEMEALKTWGITNGERPKDNLTREESWVMTYRLERHLKRYINQVLLDLRDWK